VEDGNLFSLIIPNYGDRLCTADEGVNDNNAFELETGVKH